MLDLSIFSINIYMSKYSYVTTYSCEKKDKTGSGQLAIRYNYDDADKEIKKQECLERNKFENIKYRMENPLKNRKIRQSKKGSMDPDNPGVGRAVDYGINYLDIGIFEVTNKLPEMDLDIGTGNSICILGSSKAGKTTVMMRLYEKYFKSKDMELDSITGERNNEYNYNFLFSVNSHADVYNIYKDGMNREIHSRVNPEKSVDYHNTIVDKFNKHCEVLLQQLKKTQKITNNQFTFNIILDDIVDAKYSNVLNNLILTWRNSMFSSIISLQYPYLLNKASRSSINHCIFGYFNTDESIETVIKSFLSSTFNRMGYTTMPAQIDLYRRLTADHHFLYFYSRKNILIRFKLQL